MKQEQLAPLYDALKMMVDAIPDDYVFPETDVSRRMDEYLEGKL